MFQNFSLAFQLEGSTHSCEPGANSDSTEFVRIRTSIASSRARLYRAAAWGTWRPAENRANSACRGPLPRQGRWPRSASYAFGAPRWGCPWRVPPSLVLGCMRCVDLVFVDSVTDASGFLYRPSFDGGLGRCTGAVSCGRQHLSFRVGGRHAQVTHVCACACSWWSGWAGRPPGRFLCAPQVYFGRFVLLLCLAPSGLGLPLLGFFSFRPIAPSLLAPLLSLAFCAFRPRVPFALPLCVFSCPPPFVCFFPSLLFLSSCAMRPSCLWLTRSLVSGLGCPRPWRCAVSCPPLSFFSFAPVLPLCVLCLAQAAVAVRCAACRAVVPRLVLLWAAARCAVFFRVAFCVLFRALPCCWLPLCAVLHLSSCCPSALFALWLAVAPWAALPRAVPKALLPKGKRPGCLPTGTGKRAGLCVLFARCA